MTNLAWRVIEGDCVESMRAMPAWLVDAVVCDPPYGLEFMGKEWGRLDTAHKRRDRVDEMDSSKSAYIAHSVESGYGEPLNRGFKRCLKCGRTEANHRRNPMGCIAPQWDRKIAEYTKKLQDWHAEWAREALRILKPGGYLLAFGGTRTYHRLASGIEDAGFEIRDTIAWMYGSGFPKSLNLTGDRAGWGTALKPAHEPIVVARKPLAGTVSQNCLDHGTGALNVDGCRIDGNTILGAGIHNPRWPANVVFDSEGARFLDEQTGGASRFFYCAKASRAERGEHNMHPTVKPVELMRWLTRLVTPPNGTVLDPFAGSGTTGIAALREGFSFIGIEREAEYVAIARGRITDDAPLFNQFAEDAA